MADRKREGVTVQVLRAGAPIHQTEQSDSPDQRLDAVEKWLTSATAAAQKVASTVGSSGSTRTNHVPGWLEALKHYRRVHNV